MKIAYLILCHKNSEQINQLILSLDYKDIDFYIHIDKKSNIKSQIINRENIKYVANEKRIDVQWGTVSMIEATLELIKTMIFSGINYDYVSLISGQDFPLKNPESISTILENDKDINYIEIIKPGDKKYLPYLKRNILYYPKSFMKMNYFSRMCKITYQMITGGMKHIYFLKRKTDLNFYYGSQWWTLTFDCVKQIYELSNKRNDILEFYKNSLVPDESYIQTLFMMTNYSQCYKNTKMYTNWEESFNHPKTFTKRDKDELKNASKEYFFARKFDSNLDNEIMSILPFDD